MNKVETLLVQCRDRDVGSGVFVKDLNEGRAKRLARDGVSREVPCSALKGETVPDSLPATPKSPPTRRVPPRGTPRVPLEM